MSGRQENDMKTEKRIKNILSKSYSIVDDYYYGLVDKTPLTKLGYIKSVIKFLDYIHYDNNPEEFKKIKPSDINKYMAETRYREDGSEKSVSARCSILFAISSFFEFLEAEGYVNDNICKKVNPPKITEEKEVVAMTEDEIEEVISNINRWAKKKWKERDLALFILGCTTGLRVSSIQEINIGDIDFEKNTILVTEKGNKIRSCHVGPVTMEHIVGWINDRKKILGDQEADALFISNRKTRISVGTIRNLIEFYTSSLKKHITPHKMRSTCATNLYDKTGDIYLVQQVLGHKNIANTKRYARISEEKMDMAASVLDELVR